MGEATTRSDIAMSRRIPQVLMLLFIRASTLQQQLAHPHPTSTVKAPHLPPLPPHLLIRRESHHLHRSPRVGILHCVGVLARDLIAAALVQVVERLWRAQLQLLTLLQGAAAAAGARGKQWTQDK